MEGIRGETKLSIIVAMDRSGVIGDTGKLPWRLPEDMRYFRLVTMGHPVIMGRKTYEGLASPLRGRRMIVMTRKQGFPLPAEVAAAGSVEQAVALLSPADEAFVAGGAEVYALFLPLAARLYVTLVYGEHRGDTHFPPVDWLAWRLLRERKSEGVGESSCLFRVYERAATER
jgi:dihydrofolate reductase